MNIVHALTIGLLGAMATIALFYYQLVGIV